MAPCYLLDLFMMRMQVFPANLKKGLKTFSSNPYISAPPMMHS